LEECEDLPSYSKRVKKKEGKEKGGYEGASKRLLERPPKFVKVKKTKQKTKGKTGPRRIIKKGGGLKLSRGSNTNGSAK